jgi:tRNA:m4X modification enzyme
MAGKGTTDQDTVLNKTTPKKTMDIFVGNIAPETSEAELLAALRAACSSTAVVTIRLPCCRRSGRRREYGFLSFCNIEDRKVALTTLTMDTCVVSVRGRVLQFSSSHCNGSTSTSKKIKTDVDKARNEKLNSRIPCPMDGTHSIRFARLRQHLLVCPARNHGKQRWYKKAVNLPKEKKENDCADCNKEELLPRKKLSQKELETLRQALLSSMAIICEAEQKEEEETPRYNSTNETPPLEVLQPPSLTDYVRSAPTGKHNPESLKHRSQQASIVAHVEKLGAFSSAGPPTSVIEFGAGSGFLSAAFRAAYSKETAHAKFFLVDRQTPSLRRGDKRIVNIKPVGGDGDGDRIGNGDGDGSGSGSGDGGGDGTTETTINTVSCERVRCDLADLCLDGLLQEKGTVKDMNNAKEHTHHHSIVGIGKHLCGEATDLSLRCFASRGSYLALAPCCYHRCRWETLCGRDILETAGLTRDIFQQALRLSPMDHNVENQDSIDGSRRADPALGNGCDESGRQLKREIAQTIIKLVNFARNEWLSKRGWSSRVVQYIQPSVTPQNLLLVARANFSA